MNFSHFNAFSIPMRWMRSIERNIHVLWFNLFCPFCVHCAFAGAFMGFITRRYVFNLLFRCVNFIFRNSQLFVVRSIVEHFPNTTGGTIHCVPLPFFLFHLCFTINKINEIRAFVYTLGVCVYRVGRALLPHGMVLIFSTTIHWIYITTTTATEEKKIRESKILMEICAHIMIIYKKGNEANEWHTYATLTYKLPNT